MNTTQCGAVSYSAGIIEKLVDLDKKIANAFYKHTRLHWKKSKEETNLKRH